MKEETRLKMKLAKLGKKRKPFSEDTKRKMSLSKKGKLPNNYGKARSLLARIKHSQSMKGDKSPLWRGGVSKLNKSERQLAMDTLEYKLWRESIFLRDNWTCIWCYKRGRILNADHIKPWRDYPELRFAIDNGRTLCVECHRKTDTYGFKKVFKQK